MTTCFAHTRAKRRPILLSTGMSSREQIDHAVDVLGDEALVLLHCTSAYPAGVEDLNLRVIPWLAGHYDVPVGYSGHEVGLSTTLAAVALGACLVERHLTLDRAMWGSDQAASVEPQGFARLVRDIRAITHALGDGVKRVHESEFSARDKLRRTRPAESDRLTPPAAGSHVRPESPNTPHRPIDSVQEEARTAG